MAPSISQLFNLLFVLAFSAHVLAVPNPSPRIGRRECTASLSPKPSAAPSTDAPKGNSGIPNQLPVNNVDVDPIIDGPAQTPDLQTPDLQTPADHPNSNICISNLLPSLSRHIDFHQPLPQILSHTTSAIRVLTSQVNAKTGQFKQGDGEFFVWASSNGWTSIAINDRLNGKKEFEQDVDKGLQAMADHWVMGGEKWKVPLVNEFNDDSGWAGLAAAEAYEAYGGDKYLNWAIGVFDVSTPAAWIRIIADTQFLRAHGYVDQAAIDKGFLDGTKSPDVKILKECNGKSLLGGVGKYYLYIHRYEHQLFAIV